jgi:hypothetical protein
MHPLLGSNRPVNIADVYHNVHVNSGYEMGASTSMYQTSTIFLIGGNSQPIIQALAQKRHHSTAYIEATVKMKITNISTENDLILEISTADGEHSWGSGSGNITLTPGESIIYFWSVNGTANTPGNNANSNQNVTIGTNRRIFTSFRGMRINTTGNSGFVETDNKYLTTSIKFDFYANWTGGGGGFQNGWTSISDNNTTDFIFPASDVLGESHYKMNTNWKDVYVRSFKMNNGDGSIESLENTSDLIGNSINIEGIWCNPGNVFGKHTITGSYIGMLQQFGAVEFYWSKRVHRGTPGHPYLTYAYDWNNGPDY